MAQDKEKVSIREFARQMGVSDTIVRKRMYHETNNPDGGLRMCQTVNEGNGRPMIFLEVGVQEWIAAGYEMKQSATPATAEGANLATRVADILTKSNKSSDPSDPDTMNIFEAERRKKVADALSAELKYQKELGTMVLKSDVYKVLYEFGQEAGAMLMQIIPRLAPELAVETDTKKIINMLRSEFEKFRMLMARGPQTGEQENDYTGETAEAIKAS